MSKNNFNSDLVRELATLLDETGLSEIEYGQDDWHIRIAKGGGTVVQASVPVPAAAPAIAAPASAPAAGAGTEEDLSSHPGAVTSPMVGVIYLSPDPDSANFVQVGDSVSEGETLCLVEAMKVFNPITAPRAGKVTRITVANNAPVEFGEVLFVIE